MQVDRADHRRTSGSGIAPVRVAVFSREPAGQVQDDSLAVEAPLEVRIGGKPITVLMRTPGHDEELVTGFLFNEGVIADADDLIAIERPTDATSAERENVVHVSLMTSRRTPSGDRLFFSNSSCGICGKQSLASIEVRGTPVRSDLTVPRPRAGRTAGAVKGRATAVRAHRRCPRVRTVHTRGRTGCGA